MLIAWDSTYDIGHADIDREHRAVIDCFNRLIGQGDPSPQLEYLFGLVQTHFEREERLMQAGRYPGYAEHKELHDRFLADMVGAKKEWDAHKSQTALSRIVVGLAQWWMGHIRKVDQQYKDWVVK